MTPITLSEEQCWQTSNLDYAIDEEFFGSKWMAYRDTPVRSKPGYPQECIIRKFLSAKMLANPDWQQYLAEHECRDADGSEPLAYCYCSSQGGYEPPHYSGHASAIAVVEKELRRRKLWSEYRTQLWVQITQQADDLTIDESRLADADCATRCVAALAVVGSKHVKASE